MNLDALMSPYVQEAAVAVSPPVAQVDAAQVNASALAGTTAPAAPEPMSASVVSPRHRADVSADESEAPLAAFPRHRALAAVPV